MKFGRLITFVLLLTVVLARTSPVLHNSHDIRQLNTVPSGQTSVFSSLLATVSAIAVVAVGIAGAWLAVTKGTKENRPKKQKKRKPKKPEP